MTSFLRAYGTTLGPSGIPMRDDQEFSLDAIFKQLISYNFGDVRGSPLSCRLICPR